MHGKGVGSTLVALAAAAVLLGACDEAEQDRILRYEKGTYLGPQDRALTAEEQADLRARTRMQGGL